MIDKIYYINLDKRTDRKGRIEELLKKSKLFNISERIPAILNKKGAIGCTQSHIFTLEKFLKTDYKTCLILEDDFTTNETSTLKSNIEKLFNDNIIFDVVQISGNHIKLEECEYKYLKSVHNSQTTSGYIVSKEFAPILLNNFKTAYNLAIKNGVQHSNCLDIHWKKLQPISKWYCFYPTLGTQEAGFSDIEGRNVSYKC